MRKLRDSIVNYVKTADIALLFLALVISAYGIVAIYGATRALSTNRYVFVQSVAICAGAVGYIMASLIDLRRFPKLWIILFFANILLQLSLQFLGAEDTNGNKAWIPLGSTGLTIQPGEIGKIIFIYTLASHMQQLKDKLNRPLSIVQLAAHMGITTLAVFFVSRDMGVALLYPLIFIVMLFAGGVSLGWLLAGLVAMVGMAWPLWHMMADYQQLRILVLFEPSRSARYYWHTQQSLDALARGGVSGVGLGNNRHFVYNHSDFIFAALCEQFGFIGGAILVVLLTLLVFRVLYDSTRSDDLFGRLLCIGIGGMYMVQILINIGMCVGIMPVIGITLPLVSYGGTSVAIMLASLGFVSGITMRRKPQWLRNTQ